MTGATTGAMIGPMVGVVSGRLPASLFIPSPGEGVWHLGPLPIRGYALCIIAGIIAAIVIGERRWQARGGHPGEVQDLAIWAVPFGLVGARLYHVITDHDLYFGAGGHPWEALYIWRGGLGVWGAVSLGAVGVLIGARRRHIRVAPVLDALAPGVLVAQACGRWGNYFNQELFGRPTTLPWGLKIDPEHRPVGYEQFATFHPTFLYESIWDLAVFAVLIALDRPGSRWRGRIGHGRMVALYVMGYTLGRGWIETLRVDTVEYEHVWGLRLNVWTSIVLFVLAAVYFVVSLRRHPGREERVFDDAGPGDATSVDATSEGSAAAGSAAAGSAAAGSAPGDGASAALGEPTSGEPAREVESPRVEP